MNVSDVLQKAKAKTGQAYAKASGIVGSISRGIEKADNRMEEIRTSRHEKKIARLERETERETQEVKLLSKKESLEAELERIKQKKKERQRRMENQNWERYGSSMLFPRR